MKPLLVSTLCASLATTSAQAEDLDAYVESNLLSILYHELGHAIIDLMALPVFGQEEDAADVASVLLIDQLFEEEVAVNIAYDSAAGFLTEESTQSDEVAWWDVHGVDLQRYYTFVCLFVGADLEAREDIAHDLGLPEERLDTCEEEFALAYDSWNPVFDDLSRRAPGRSIVYLGGQDTLTEQLVADEVAALNDDFRFPYELRVSVQDCGEANAFYDPNTVEIIMCSELDPWLRANAPG